MASKRQLTRINEADNYSTGGVTAGSIHKPQDNDRLMSGSSAGQDLLHKPQNNDQCLSSGGM
jgi:hypothetical protein